MKPLISRRDLKLLSLYLDEQLNPAQRQHLEKRLEENQALRLALVELRQTRMVLRALPRAISPRNFTLTPQMIGLRAPRPVYPVLGFVSALASFLFILVLAGDLLGIFTHASGSVAMRQVPLFEAGAPGLENIQEKSVQEVPPSTPLLAETQVVQAQVALKAAEPAADESAMLITETSPPTPAEPAPEAGETAAPILEGMYAKEAPAQDLGVSGEIGGAGVITDTEVIEKELPPMETSTGNLVAEAAAPSPTIFAREAAPTPSAPPQEAVLPAAPAVAKNVPPSEASSSSQPVGEEETMTETGAQDQDRLLGPEERPAAAQSGQLILWVLEGIFAGTALITGLLVFIQRRRLTR